MENPLFWRMFFDWLVSDPPTGGELTNHQSSQSSEGATADIAPDNSVQSEDAYQPKEVKRLSSFYTEFLKKFCKSEMKSI